MIKTLTTAKVRKIGSDLLDAWEDDRKKEIKIKGKALFNLIGLKKKIEEQYNQIQETITGMALAEGGVFQENGSIKIPEENIQTVNKKLQDFGEELIEIDYKEIDLSDEDYIPMEILEALYDFIILE